jgi:hypothetical protein
MFHALVINFVGQFMLREILENHLTQTHRTTVAKDKVIFIVNVTEGYVSPQLYSRAHQVMNVDDTFL